MKKQIWLLLLLAMIWSCGGGEDDPDEPNITRDYINVVPNVELLGDGQTQEIDVSANCNWTIAKDAEWLSVTPTSGTNNQTITISAGKNSTGQARTAVLTIKGGSAPTRMVTITQSRSSDSQKESNTLQVSVSTLEFSADGGAQTFTIRSNTNWTISKPDWCTLSEVSGSGDATITVTADENADTAQRSGTIVVSGNEVSPLTINVIQKAKEEDTQREPGAGDNLPPS